MFLCMHSQLGSRGHLWKSKSLQFYCKGLIFPKSVVHLTQQATAVHMLHKPPAKLQTSTKVHACTCRSKQNRSTLNQSIPMSTSIMGKSFFWDNLKAIDEMNCYHMPLYKQAYHHKPPPENLYKARHSMLTRLGHWNYHNMPTHCNTPPQNPVWDCYLTSVVCDSTAASTEGFLSYQASFCLLGSQSARLAGDSRVSAPAPITARSGSIPAPKHSSTAILASKQLGNLSSWPTLEQTAVHIE